MPDCGSTDLNNSLVPPYNAKCDNIVSPDCRLLINIVVMALWPLACSNAFSFNGLPSALKIPKDSSAAMVSSAAVNVGFPQRL